MARALSNAQGAVAVGMCVLRIELDGGRKIGDRPVEAVALHQRRAAVVAVARSPAMRRRGLRMDVSVRIGCRRTLPHDLSLPTSQQLPQLTIPSAASGLARNCGATSRMNSSMLAAAVSYGIAPRRNCISAPPMP